MLTNAPWEFQTVPAMQMVESAGTPMEAIFARVEQVTLEMEDCARVGIFCFLKSDVLAVKGECRHFYCCLNIRNNRAELCSSNHFLFL